MTHTVTLSLAWSEDFAPSWLVGIIGQVLLQKSCENTRLVK